MLHKLKVLLMVSLMVMATAALADTTVTPAVIDDNACTTLSNSPLDSTAASTAIKNAYINTAPDEMAVVNPMVTGNASACTAMVLDDGNSVSSPPVPHAAATDDLMQAGNSQMVNESVGKMNALTTSATPVLRGNGSSLNSARVHKGAVNRAATKQEQIELPAIVSAKNENYC